MSGATRRRCADREELLRSGELSVRGRIMPASNLTTFAELTKASASAECVYKPVAGERPLWDFPEGTLAAREVAADLVSRMLGWDLVPPTVLRDGPAGLGMVQLWVDVDEETSPVDLVPAGRVPPGHRHVLDAMDGEGRPVALVHEDNLALRRMAVFDVVINNGDRKGGHVLACPDGHRYGVDHGVSFHVQNKLRTVLWGWAGEALTDDERDALGRVRDALQAPDDPYGREIRDLLSPEEIAATAGRCSRLLYEGRMPEPSADWPSIPWPAF